MGKWNKFLQELLLGGKKCVYCGREIPYEDLFCEECAGKEEALRNKDGFAGGILYAYRYEDIVRTLIHQFKYNDMPRYSMFIAQRMAEFLADYEVNADGVTYVPIHKNRLKMRGYDQTELIASHLSTLLDVPCGDFLLRVRDTRPQYKLGARERQKNIRGAFSLREDANVEGRNLLLIDDIYTTGATVGECVRILADAGANVTAYTYSREFLKPEKKK